MFKSLLLFIRHCFDYQPALEAITYRIISIDDSYLDSKKIVARVQLVGTSKMFNRSIEELYQRQWLNHFSKEDVAHIAALYTAQQTHQFDLIKYFPKQNPTIKPSVFIVGILFTACLILANLTAVKLVSIGPFVFAAGLIFFPITYIFDDILTEVYGFKISRRIIWSALLANLVIFAGTWLTTYLPAAPDWQYEAAYEAIFRMTPRIFMASMLGYFFGEFANSIILAKMKILTSGKFLWLRVITSSVVGVGIDTLIFVHAAFLYIIPYSALWQVIATSFSVKIIYEICAIPITYKITNYLKHKDNIDHYDFTTKFNPFSLTL